MANQFGFYTPRPPRPKKAPGPPKPSGSPVQIGDLSGLPGSAAGEISSLTGRPIATTITTPPAATTTTPAPIDWNALTLSNPQYTTGVANLDLGHQLNEKNIAAKYAAEQQGGGDNTNAHGVLNSGIYAQLEQNAATHNQTAENTEALNYATGKNNLYWSVYNNLVANPPLTPTTPTSSAPAPAAAGKAAAKKTTTIKAPKLTGRSTSRGYSGNPKGGGL